MKKNTLETLIAYLDGATVTNLDEIKAELEAELNRGREKAAANRQVYAEIHDKVMEVLRSATAPVTGQELADETGIARGKIVYGLNNYWTSEIVKDTSGKTAVYSLA